MLQALKRPFLRSFLSCRIRSWPVISWGMKFLSTRESRHSWRNWPPVEIEQSGSLRLSLGWALWCLALTMGLWFGCALPWWIRLGLSQLALGAGWCGASVLLGRRAGTNGRVRWQADGRWWFAQQGCQGAGQGVYVQPGSVCRLGGFLWLRWRDSSGWRYFVADGGNMEPMALARLKARMKFTRPMGLTGAP